MNKQTQQQKKDRNPGSVTEFSYVSFNINLPTNEQSCLKHS